MICYFFTKPLCGASAPARSHPARFPRGWFGGFFCSKTQNPDLAASGSVRRRWPEPAHLTADPSIQAAKRVFKPVKRVGVCFNLSIFSHLEVSHA